MSNVIKNVIRVNGDKVVYENFKNAISAKTETGKLVVDFNNIVKKPESLGIDEPSFGVEEAVGLLVYLILEKNIKIKDISYFSDDIYELTKCFVRAHVVMAKRKYINNKKINFDYLNKNGLVQKSDESKDSDLNALIDFLTVAHQYSQNILNYGAPTAYEWCVKYWGTKCNACNSEFFDNKKTIVFETPYSSVYPLFSKMLENEDMKDIEIIYGWASEDKGQNVGEVILKNGETIDKTVFEVGSKESLAFAYNIWS